MGFDEDLNVAVFTTRFVMYDKEPILFVFHHEEDGYWQFSGDQECKDSDILLVSLEEMITHDATILEVAGLPYGWKAERDSWGTQWVWSINE